MKPVLLLGAVAMLASCSLWQSDESATPDAKPVAAVSTGPISVVWSSDVDHRLPATAPGFSQPVVAQADGAERIVIGGQDRKATVLAADGSEIDRVALGAPGESGGVQLDNSLVVVGDLDGRLVAIDPFTAKAAWRVDLASAVAGSPVAVAGGFIVQTVSNQLYRFTNDGAKVWSFSGALGGLSMHLKPSPLVDGDRVYAVMANADVVALKVDSGSFIWKRQLLLDSEAMVLGDLKVPLATPVLIPVEHSGLDEPLLAVPVFQGQLFLLSTRDGSTIFSRHISTKASPLLLAGRLYVADASGNLVALAASSGDTVWKQHVSDGELVGPVLWNDQLWLADHKGTVYRVNRDGEVQASIKLPGRIDRTPVPSASGVLVRNSLGTLYMLH